jgi:hypothetical protein
MNMRLQEPASFIIMGIEAAAGDMLSPEPRLIRYAEGLFCAAQSAAKIAKNNKSLGTLSLSR